MVQKDFPLYVEDEKLVPRMNVFLTRNLSVICAIQACILMNNIQQSRVQLEKMYAVMGGEQLNNTVQQMLNDLQMKLNNVLEKLANIFAQRQEKMTWFYFMTDSTHVMRYF